jgi:hypothetical protein
MFTTQEHRVSRHRKAFALGLLILIAVSVGMAAIAVGRYPAFLLQPGARIFLFEPIGALLVYAVGIFLLSRAQGSYWDAIRKTAMVFGVLTGMLEILNIGIENGIPFLMSGPRVALGFMLVVFTLWGVAGFRTAKSLGSVGAALLAAIASAGICMLIAVAAGFAVQFFVAPPDPAQISIRAEYQRSGWTDPRAFGLANTLESGFTHLVVAPIVATLFGGVGALLARLKKSKT